MPSSPWLCSGRVLINANCSPIAGCRKRRLCGDWTTKSSWEQRSISSWVCFPILVQPRDQPNLPLDNRNNGGSDHQVMVLPCPRELFHHLLADSNYHSAAGNPFLLIYRPSSVDASGLG